MDAGKAGRGMGEEAAGAGAVGVCRRAWAEAGERSEWRMAGGAQSGMTGE